jgi:hypothetical protein
MQGVPVAVRDTEASGYSVSALLLDEHPPRPFGESCWINGCYRDRLLDGFLCALHAPQAARRVAALPEVPEPNREDSGGRRAARVKGGGVSDTAAIKYALRLIRNSTAEQDALAALARLEAEQDEAIRDAEAWASKFWQAERERDDAMETIVALRDDSEHDVAGLDALAADVLREHALAEAAEARVRQLEEVLEPLIHEASKACTEPRRFHENEDARQQSLSQAIARARRRQRTAA